MKYCRWFIAYDYLILFAEKVKNIRKFFFCLSRELDKHLATYILWNISCLEKLSLKKSNQKRFKYQFNEIKMQGTP